jgi:biopolymer transport protein ExbB
METQKPNAAKANNAALKPGSNVRGIKNAFLVIIVCFVVAVTLFLFVFGSPSHFDAEGYEGASMWFAPEEFAKAHPLDLVGTIFKGGIIVPVLQTLFLTVIVLSVERWIALKSAKGNGSIATFVADVKKCLAKNDIEGAQNLCKKQRGSVAAVVSAALTRYAEMDTNTVLSKEQKIATIQKELEEATAIEMPSLQQNLPIVATLTTLGTLVGLLGTVIGMIKSFQALSASGAPDSTELSTGISEALVNTAFGIATGAFAVISYNFYTNKIDNLTYAIDEVGFSIVQSFAATH